MAARTITTTTFLAALMSVAAEGAAHATEDVKREPDAAAMAAVFAAKDVRFGRASTARAATQPG